MKNKHFGYLAMRTLLREEVDDLYPWGAPFLSSTRSKSNNKKGGELEGLT
jgi:hypothetical protein